MITVEPGNPRDPAARTLLEESQALMRALFNPEDNHFLSLDALCGPDVRFFIARRRADTLGCGALALREGYGEIKSLFVAPPARGSGIADALIRCLEDEARKNSLPLVRLETGDTLLAARRLYERHGFAECGPFGDYRAAPASVFMEKRLD